MRKENALDPGDWLELENLFDRLLDSDAPDCLIAGLGEGPVKRELIRLWGEHCQACDSPFLRTPVANVHALMEPVYCFAPGQVLAHRFRVERLLGAGGMGEVYLAYDQRLSQFVALKTVAWDLARREDLRSRFVAEVQNARQVTHRNVCRIFDLFDEEDRPFFAMEYLQGPSLSLWMRSPAATQALRLRIALDLAEGVMAAHESGVIHRDLKPSNVIVTGPFERPRAVITDFGLAKAFEGSELPAQLSLQAGTANYMAPELRRGAAATKATDIYAFGAILKQLLPNDRAASACTAERPENRPLSLESFIERRKGGATRRWLIFGSIASPLVALAGYRALSRPRIVFGSRQRISFSGFEPRADTVARTLRDLLMTALRQSPLVNVISGEGVAATAGFVLQGSLNRTGKTLRLAIAVIDAATGQRAVEIAESGTETGFVPVANRAAVRLRREFGESAESLRSTYKDLAQATSAIPEAVQAYFEGVRLYEGGDAPRSLIWFDRALELDPQFALAHLYRGLNLAASDDAVQAFPSYERAYRLRDRVAERERLWIESRFANITEDRLGAVNILRHLVQLYPDEAVFRRHMGFALARVLRPAESIEHDRRAIELDAASVNNRNVLLCDLAQAGRYDESIETFRQFRAQGIASPLLENGPGIAWEAKGNYAEAQAAFDRMTDSAERDHQALLPRAGLLVLSGRFREAAGLLESDLAFEDAVARSTARETRRVWLGLTEYLLDQPEKARLRAAAIAQLPVTQPVYLTHLHEGALLASLSGSADLCLNIAAKLAAIRDAWPSTHSRGVHAHAEALAKQAVLDPSAEVSFREAHGLWPGPLVVFSLAQWQRKSGDFAGALATLDEFDRLEGDILRNHFTGLVALGWMERGLSLKSLSRKQEASRLFRRVLDCWGEAGASFSTVRSARQNYLDSIR